MRKCSIYYYMCMLAEYACYYLGSVRAYLGEYPSRPKGLKQSGQLLNQAQTPFHV